MYFSSTVFIVDVEFSFENISDFYCKCNVIISFLFFLNKCVVVVHKISHFHVEFVCC